MSDTDNTAWDAAASAEGRFRFGENWRRFLSVLDDGRIEESERALADMLGVSRLDGRTFLDAGSGSGLSSLAARRLGARVHAFDFDPQSVACTRELRERYFPRDPSWTVESGSALDAAYLDTLRQFDIVYSWGVLHHTGSMWPAIDLVSQRVSGGGLLFIAIYNEQGWISTYWSVVKRIYNSGAAGRWAMIAVHAPYLIGVRFLVRALTGRLVLERGMSLWYDMLDWLGGWPFETATPAALESFLGARGFKLVKSRLAGRRPGCNELVFRRVQEQLPLAS